MFLEFRTRWGESRSTLIIGSVVLTIVIQAGFVASAQAGGLYLSEFGTAEMGVAGAGETARASDASTAIFNPAGMTRLDDHQLNLGLAPGYGQTKFDPDSGTTRTGGDGGNQGGFVPLLGSSYSHKLTERWRAGAALISIAGATLDPDNDWVARSQVSEISLFTLTFIPSLAVELTDWLSIGGGPAITYGNLDWDLIATLPGPLGREAKVKVENADDIATAAYIGLLIEPTAKLRVGFLYQGKTDLRLKGKTKIPAGVSASTKIGLPLAESYRADLFWEATDHWALLLGGAYENWSSAKTVPLSIAAGSTEVPLGFEDTWKIHAGLHYRLDERWTFTVGGSYDSSALERKTRTAALPVDRQVRVGAGVIHQYDPNTQLVFAFEWLDLGKAKLDIGGVKGDYTDNRIFFLCFNMNWSKLPWSGKGTY